MTPETQNKYDELSLPAYTPLPWSLKEIREAIPARYFVKSTFKSLSYFGRDAVMALVVFRLAFILEHYFLSDSAKITFTPLIAECFRCVMWLLYWWFQGLIFTGIWVIGHECGHGAFSDCKLLNDTIGLITHTFLFTPYFSWRISHHRHHANHASMEHDEVYVPKTRTDLAIPQKANHEVDWDEIFGDTPIYTFFRLLAQQLLAFPSYLLFNVSGQKTYPKWTNHFNPESILFNRLQRNAVFASDAAMLVALFSFVRACSFFGTIEVIKFYGIPWLLVTHWFIMITYLHHTDPVLPHYRKMEWNFQRGAAATIDRDFLGWQGRFFLHDVSHYHVIHHFFPKMPFYHGPEATSYLKGFLKEHYVYSNKPVFQALWYSYNECQFVEDQGNVLFYRNKKGEAVRRPA